eukprot:jgi/Chlat1/3939/Chrsp26S04199
MADSDGGIQALLAAEQEAQSIVAAARAAKASRLKQAREEAEAEIAAYRQQREESFKKALTASSGDAGSTFQRLEVETKQQIAGIDEATRKLAPEVSNMLLKMVTTVQ